MRLLAALLLATALGCAARGPAPAPARAEADPAAAAGRFFAAVEAARWDDAYLLLSATWRARLTPDRLAADRAQGGALAVDRLTRARLALQGAPAIEGGEARYPLGGGGALRLVLEPGGWRVDALE